MTHRSTMGSPYMQFAKLNSTARYNLAASGVASYPLSQLPFRLDQMEINGPTIYGYAPLQERIAKKNQVSPDCVVAAAGASMANHLAMAATFDPGDDVLIEDPTYELLTSTARYLGAAIRKFPRRFDQDFRLDPEIVAKHITPRTKLIILTNLHNPSSAFTDETTLATVGEVARSVGARVLVDEVYVETLFDRPVRSAFHLDDTFVVTNSLTKAYGLSGLRCGWVLAQPDLARRMWRINDLYGATPVHPAELLSVIAFDHLDQIAARAGALLEANRRNLNNLLDSSPGIECFRPEFGTVVFPRLRNGQVDEFFERLKRNYDTSFVPGRFFDMPEHFRIGIGGDEEMTAEGLRRLRQGLEKQSVGS